MNKYTLVTGATSGIGKGVAERLSKNSNVIIHGRNEDELKLLVQEFDAPVFYWCCDLSNAEQIQDSLKELLIKNDAVVNKFIHCAGVDNTFPSKALRSNTINNLMKVNFYSAVEIINLLLKKSVNKNVLENILFISSISSIKAYKAKAAYSASKAALDAYMKVLSLELAPKIRVNSILPGGIKTKMTEAVFNDENMIKHLEEIYPLGIGNIENIVDVVEFYNSDKSSWVTGQQIVVDGGHTV